MQITSIEAIPVRLPLKPERRMVSALGRHETSNFVLVRLLTADGLEGLGEATVTPQWSGETMWGAVAMIRDVLAPQVIGCRVDDVDSLLARMRVAAIDNPFAKAAIEMACWDAHGKARGVPVYELLGGAVRSRTIRCRFSLGAYPPDVAAERAAERIAAGFTTIKVKVGVDPATDVQRVAAVRQAIGRENTLTIDANGGWTYEQAVDALEQMKPFQVTLVEQPLQRGDYAGLRRLREQCGLPILADESCFRLVEARELIEQQCCDSLTVYPGKHGGIRPAVEIAELAEQHRLPCTIGSNLEWDIGAAAMMHFVVATPNVQIDQIPGDCLGPSYHLDTLAEQPLVIEGPLVTVPDRPGLGVELDWDQVARYRVES